MLLDNYGRIIDTLRISVTSRCNFRCTYCTGEEGCAAPETGRMLTALEIISIVRAAAGEGIIRIRFTGGEPLLRPDLEEMVRGAAAVPGIGEVTLTTNGTLLSPERAAALKEAGLARMNISLDTLDPYLFRRITRGGNVDDVIRGISAAHQAGFTGTKVNMVVFEDTAPEEMEDMRTFCAVHGARLQTIARFALAEGRHDPAAPVHADRPHACATCSRLRLTADGHLLPCLFSDTAVPVDCTDPAAGIRRAVALKPENGSVCRSRTMMGIGG